MVRTLKDINWNQVYCFYEVARKTSMKEAGKLLGVSTPTISEQIKKLETVLGIKLFNRYPRKIQLTREGESLFNCAKEIFDAGGRFLDTISPNFIGGYAVKVGIQEMVLAAVATDFVNRYWDLFAPYGTVNTIREPFFDRIIENLIRGEFDWAITMERPRSLKLNYKQISSCEIVLCCSTRIFNKFKNKKDILRTIPLARSSWDRLLNQSVDDHLREADIFPEEIIESDHLDFCLELAKRGRCVVTIAKETLKKLNISHSLKAFTVGRPIHIKLFAVWLTANEKMVSLKKLTELINMSQGPSTFNDPDLQLRVSDVAKDKLNDN